MTEYPTTLHYVPPVVADQIFDHLPMADLKSLRFVSRHMNARVTRRCFARHTTVLTASALTRTEHLIKHELLGGLVNHLRIVADCAPSHSSERTLESNDSLATGKSDAQLSPYPRDSLESLADEHALQQLAAILGWGGRMSLKTLELDARSIVGSLSDPNAATRRFAELDQQRLWARASQLYRLTMIALAGSGVAIPDLRIYNNTAGCCVPSYDITIGLPRLVDAGLAQCGPLIKHFALSFSTRVDHGWDRLTMVYGADAAATERRRERRHWDQIADEVEWDEMAGVAAADNTPAIEFDVDGSEYDTDDEADESIRAEKGSELRGRYTDSMPQAICEDNFPGVAALLKHMPNLESLDLHMYQTLEYEAYDGLSRLYLYARVFKGIVGQNLQFNKLRHMTLRGICLSGSDLVTFMERHNHIKNLELHHVMLCDWHPRNQDWKAVLRQISQKCVLDKADGSLARVFGSDLRHVPSVGRASTSFALHDAESLRGPTEVVEQEWDDRGWCSRHCKGAAKKSRVTVHTREFSREDLKKEDLFGGSGARPPRQKDISATTAIARFDSGDYISNRERTYGTTYG